MNLFPLPLFPRYKPINEKSMEANENAKNVMMEEQQVMHPYFPEYTPMGSIEKTTGTVTEYDLIFRNNLINCVLF